MTWSGLISNLILAMFYFTGDRLCHVTLHTRYEGYWNTRRTKILISCTWVFNVFISLCLAVFCYFYYKSSSMDTLTFYIYSIVPSFIGAYIIFSIVSYAFMFHLYKKSERRMVHNASALSSYHIFKHSRFFIAIIIISAYLILTGMPSLINGVRYLSSDAGVPRPVHIYICRFNSDSHRSLMQ